jgi:transposase-like protein
MQASYLIQFKKIRWEDFIMRSTTESLILWEQRIKKRLQSGMTILEWCQKNEISKHQYNYWIHLVREKQKTDEGTAFADIAPLLAGTCNAKQKSESPSEFKLLIKDIQVTVPNDFNPSSLSGILRVLQT